MVAEDPMMISEPCVQRLVIGPHRETGVGPQGLKLAQGSVVSTPALSAGIFYEQIQNKNTLDNRGHLRIGSPDVANHRNATRNAG